MLSLAANNNLWLSYHLSVIILAFMVPALGCSLGLFYAPHTVNTLWDSSTLPYRVPSVRRLSGMAPYYARTPDFI